MILVSLSHAEALNGGRSQGRALGSSNVGRLPHARESFFQDFQTAVHGPPTSEFLQGLLKPLAPGPLSTPPPGGRDLHFGEHPAHSPCLPPTALGPVLRQESRPAGSACCRCPSNANPAFKGLSSTGECVPHRVRLCPLNPFPSAESWRVHVTLCSQGITVVT